MVALIQNDIKHAPYRLGMLVALASMVMLFTSLTSAYIVRAASSNDWITLPVPPMLWVSTGLIVISSITFEIARRSLRHASFEAYRRWLVITTALGAAFLVSQIAVWRQLVRQGIYITTSPHSSFFYLLTATHGFHLLCGLLALVYLLIRHVNRSQDQLVAGRRIVVADAAALYWHFMDVLWLYLFLLLFLWK